MMRFVRDVITNVMKQGSGREHRATVAFEIRSQAGSRQIVKDSFGQARHLIGVCFLISETTAHSMNTAQLVISQILQRRMRLSFDLAQSINKDAFAQRPATTAQSVDTKRAHGAFEDLSSGNNDLGALRADAGKRASFGKIHRRCASVESAELLDFDLISGRSRALGLPIFFA